MDLTETIAPRSDQLNADDLMSGPRTVTITEVTAGNAEQPVNVHLAEFPGRPFKPSKSMRRVMVAAWGPNTSPYAGRRMTLYRDPTIRFGKDEVGGIRISHMSHLDKRLTLALTVTRGKRAPYTVQPLPKNVDAGPRNTPAHEGSTSGAEPRVDTPTEPTPDQIATCTNTDTLRDWWHKSGDERRAQIQARVAELGGGA